MLNPFRWFYSLIRQKPAMIGEPPSSRPMWYDPEAHAADFSARYFEPMDYLVSQRMTDLGIPSEQIGSSDILNGIRHASFMPHDRIGGSNGAGGRLTVDSGVFNLELMAGKPGAKEWAAARLMNRLDAITRTSTKKLHTVAATQRRWHTALTRTCRSARTHVDYSGR